MFPAGRRPRGAGHTSACSPDPVNNPNDNRKLVEVIATKTVHFGFLRVIGINQTTVTANAVGEAATIDLVLVIDTSASMAYETVPVPSQSRGSNTLMLLIAAVISALFEVKANLS